MLLLLIASCFPKGPEFTDEYDLVATTYDKDFPFESQQTFALPDDIVKITGDAVDGGEVQFIDRTYSDVALRKVRIQRGHY